MSNLNFLHSGGNKVTISSPDSNPSSDVTFKLPQADGSSGQPLVTNGSGALSFQSVEIDQWYLSSSVFSGTTIAPGTSWTRKLKIGTGMTVSQDANGRWSFPSTGIWRIDFHVLFRPTAGDNVYFDLYVTTDSYSNTINYARAQASGTSNNNQAKSGSNSALFDVQNTSTHGLYFVLGSHASGSYTEGATISSTNPYRTSLVFTRLGDT